MSDTSLTAEALSLSESQETILLSMPALKMLLEEVGKQREEINLLKKDLKLDRADIRDLYEAIDHIEQVKISPAQKDRGEILRALLAASGGKMLAKDARKRLSMDKSSFSRLLSTMSQDITVKKFHANKRQNVIILNG